MEKQGSSSGELQCVGRLEIEKPKPVGFLCGSIPVTTDAAFRDFSSAAIVPSQHTAPRYRMIPTETDLSALPLLPSIPEKVIPIAATSLNTSRGSSWEDDPIRSSLARKGETLAVSGLVEYEDEIDVIAPADVLKQIFKIPYSKARVSVAVHRIGRTLILNSGPDVEEGERLIRRQNRQPKCADQSLFLNFAMHSVRMEACDCPPTHKTPSDEQPKTSHGDQYRSNEVPPGSSGHPILGHGFEKHLGDRPQEDGHAYHHEYPQTENKNLFLGKKKSKRNKFHEALKVSEVREKPGCPVQESEKCRKVGDDEFLRVLFWQFHKFRMLLGSDLLIFSNEKYIAVSLHLWDVSRKVTPLAWLDAWLDNFIASVPELAICYHQDGVVQGYELLKTDDIFLLKGISDEGIPAFHPHIVQQNGLSVMRFLEDNCKQDPGAYWLYKSAGEDVVQLFDLSVIPENHTADRDDDSSGSLQSYVYRGRSDSMLSLGTLLYRIAHRLSLSMSADKRARCIRFFEKCLRFLEEPDHLVVRALAHEQFARLLLTHEKELELAFALLPEESKVTIAEAEEETFEFMSGLSEPNVQDIVCRPLTSVDKLKNSELPRNLKQKDSDDDIENQNIPPPKMSQGPHIVVEAKNSSNVDSSNISVSNLEENLDHVVRDVADSLSPKLAAVHHVSQAIKSLRWTRQLQTARPDLNLDDDVDDDQTSKVDFSVCACGDPDCIEVCDIREWLPTSKIDGKLWKLVLLLGESYLALAQAYKDDGQLYQALKVVELSCLLYGSMPKDISFISSMDCCSLNQVETNESVQNAKSSIGSDMFACNGLLSPHILFWSKAWTLVGDIFTDFYLQKGLFIVKQKEIKDCDKGLRMSSQVLEEVERLKEKLGKFNQNCISCSLINCSCLSDRVSSGNSASSSNTDEKKSTHGRKQRRRLHGKNSRISLSRENNEDAYQNPETRAYDHEHMKHRGGTQDQVGTISNAMKEMDLATASIERRAERSEETGDAAGYRKESPSGVISEEKPAKKSGGIFKYLRHSISSDTECTLTVAMSCYEEAQKAIAGAPSSTTEVQSILKKKGWACNELGRYRLEMKDLGKAENAFSKAIDAFRQVKDHTNVILINLNLGHGRRALAEEIVPKIESLKSHPMLQNAYLQALETAKLQYREALRYYGAAKAELSSILTVETDPLASNLKNETLTQFAHTYLKLGMLLARENTTTEVYGNDSLILGTSQPHIDKRKHEISANDAIREALAVYESLGSLRKQEAAFAHYQLACYQRDCCLRYLASDQKENNVTKGDNSLNQKVKQYASLADRNWQKSSDFYGPETHPEMFLTILIDQSDLLFKLSSYLHSGSMLESAFSRLLEARHASKHCSAKGDVCAKFWSQLQMVLKNILTQIRSSKANKSPGDAKKYSELYKISLKSTEFSQLHTMHGLWVA